MTHRSAATRRGITRVEVAVVAVVVVVVITIALPLTKRWARDARVMQDATQLRQIHMAFATFARDQSGGLPLPSRAMLRLAGEPAAEDHTLNHTANIYSMMVMANYFTPQILVSPLETSPHVRVKDSYDWVPGVLWDDSFVMHIHDPAVGANGSYAHLAAVGDRRRLRWITDPPTPTPMFGTRAPRPVTTSWFGNLCFSDNHLETITIMPGLGHEGQPDHIYAGLVFEGQPDLVYAAEFAHPKGNQAAADVFMAIYISATEFTVEDVYDRPD